MESIAVQTQIQIVEPARQGPGITRPNRDRGDASGLELIAGGQKFVPGLGLVTDADVLENILAIKHAP